MKDDEAVSQGRRRFFAGISLIPVSVTGLVSSTEVRAVPLDKQPDPNAPPYQRTFFNESEWAFLHAACDRLIPADDIGPGAIEAGVLEFLDRHMQTPYAAGEIWYMQGPFLEAAPQFGYQGKLTLKEIFRVGIAAFDSYCQANYGGRTFSKLPHDEQEKLLKAAEGGKLKFENISAKTFFTYLLQDTRNGYFSDPSHGGNKNMGAWKMIGYPGMRADYMDWVEVRDRPYALPPVDLSGRRG